MVKKVIIKIFVINVKIFLIGALRGLPLEGVASKQK